MSHIYKNNLKLCSILCLLNSNNYRFYPFIYTNDYMNVSKSFALQSKFVQNFVISILLSIQLKNNNCYWLLAILILYFPLNEDDIFLCCQNLLNLKFILFLNCTIVANFRLALRLSEQISGCGRSSNKSRTLSKKCANFCDPISLPRILLYTFKTSVLPPIPLLCMVGESVELTFLKVGRFLGGCSFPTDRSLAIL